MCNYMDGYLSTFLKRHQLRTTGQDVMYAARERIEANRLDPEDREEIIEEIVGAEEERLRELCDSDLRKEYEDRFK